MEKPEQIFCPNQYTLCICICGGACLVIQSCPTLCDSMDCSPPSSSVLGTSQARILERFAISFSRGSSKSGDPIHTSYIGRQIL